MCVLKLEIWKFFIFFSEIARGRTGSMLHLVSKMGLWESHHTQIFCGLTQKNRTDLSFVIVDLGIHNFFFFF